MAAAALRSSAGLAALRRAAAPASSRISSAGRNAAANTSSVRAMHHDYSGGGPGQKGDGLFMAAAVLGTFVFVGLMDGDFIIFGGYENTRTPRMSSRRRL